jgi:osmotically-inducible protein OsmY
MRRGLTLMGILMVCGCGDDVDRLGRVFERTAAKFEGATESLRDKLRNGCGAVNGAVNETSLDSRVALRLHWDKDLDGVEVQVHLAGPNAVELTGLVTDLKQQRRAVELAQSTSGVERVLDRLTLESDSENP